MKQQPKTVGRFKKLELVWILICLCFENITNVSTSRSGITTKEGQSFSAQHTDNKETDDSKALTRKSRALLYNEYPSADLNFDGQYSGSKQHNANPYLKIGSNIGPEGKSYKGTLIPFPRLGRSGKFDENSIMPYPDSWLTPYLQKANKEQDEDQTFFDEMQLNQDYTAEVNSINEEQSSILDEEEGILKDPSFYPKVNSLLESSSLVKERQVDNNGTVIPYPRLGRSNANSFRDSFFKIKDDTVSRKKRSSDSLIPQFRYGRSAPPATLLKQQKQPVYILPNYRPGRSSNNMERFKFEKISKPAILPYPRPGRAGESVGKREDYMLPVPRFGKSAREDLYLQKSLINSPLMKEDIFKETNEDATNAEKSTIFLIPYPRPGKRFFGTKPLPPNVIMENKDKIQLLQDYKDSEEIPTPFVVPYPRPGRSDKTMVSSLIPSVRFGRSSANSMVPYPRLGRNDDNQDKRYYILPYPRSGRSSESFSIVPNVRFGRTDHSILPSFRFGRSSNSILPYPRLGRFSNQKLKPKNSNSEFLLPYPRLGRKRSSGIIPQIRVGKSNDFLNSMEDLVEADTHFEVLDGMKNVYLDEVRKEKELESSNLKETLGNSLSEETRFKPALLRPAKKLHKHMLTSETNYMLPYPRPGRHV